MKDNKLLYITIIMVCVTAILGVSYAWFSTIIEGNENANKYILTYTDSDIVTLENAFPGDSSEKTFTIKNSELRTYINTTLYNEFPTDLKSAVIDTTVVSGYEHGKSANYTSTDKVYLLVFKEIYSDVYDTIKDSTRQLDYYNSIDVSGDNCSGAIKKYGATASAWRLRLAKLYSNFDFNGINSDCSCGYDYVNYNYGISPAFRIG